MATVEQLVSALDRHPDFKRAVLVKLLDRCKYALDWEWKESPKDFGNTEGMYFRRVFGGGKVVNIYFNSTDEWCWTIFDPFTRAAARGATPPRLGHGKTVSAWAARKAADEWLMHSEWTLKGNFDMDGSDAYTA
ncbi:hypothetical protein N9917_00475 [Deltaproteobacteria bacterium]|nr:hypothetical protein [Deltaproteobacteria bacterium]